MFTAKGLFSSIPCPYQQTCILPRCIFKHPEGIARGSEPEALIESPASVSHGQGGQRKKQKVGEENFISSTEVQAGASSAGHESVLSNFAAVKEKPERRSLAAIRGVSPPPLKRKAPLPNDLPTTKSSTVPPALSEYRSPSKPSVKSPAQSLKKETLNPRVKNPAPASHDMRFKLVRALHEQFQRLNAEIAKDANDVEEKLVMSDQAIITKALDIEEEAAASPTIYSNLMKNKILVFKRMSVKQWVDERTIDVAKVEALANASDAQHSTPPKLVETGLALEEELTLLKDLYTPVTGLSKHGYVTSIPSAQEIETAKKGVEAAKGWEVCDRCKSRFQIFPGRREEDGALASGGKCTYHFGKPYLPEKSATDPKAKRERKYRCCGESVSDSPGCTQAECHVFKISEVKRLAAVWNFETTPENHTKESSLPVCIDGEMGYTIYGLELIRLTATSWPNKEPLFDVLVRPNGPILDLNSRYSGVWPKDMAEAPLWSSDSHSKADKLHLVESPATARSLLFSYLSPSTPLIGHGLENDLNATRVIHPTIIDTALLFPHKAGLPFRNGLKMLMQTHLNRHIQVVKNGKMEGHDSKEDANAAGELVRFALAEKWKKMTREGWILENGEFRKPSPKGSLSLLPPGSSIPTGSTDTSSNSAPKKRCRDQMEADAEA